MIRSHLLEIEDFQSKIDFIEKCAVYVKYMCIHFEMRVRYYDIRIVYINRFAFEIRESKRQYFSSYWFSVYFELCNYFMSGSIVLSVISE